MSQSRKPSLQEIDLNAFVDRIFVINLDHRSDRWEQVRQELRQNNITNFERFSGIRPCVSQLPPQWKRVKPAKKEANLTKYQLGVAGCKLSHYYIVLLAKLRGYRSIIILEDDVQFAPNWKGIWSEFIKELYKKPPSFKMIYLGGKDVKVEPYSRHIKRVKSIKTTHAYCITSDIFDFVVDTLLKYSGEIDNFYIKYVQSQCPCYRISPGILIQRDGYSDILGQKVSYRTIT